MNFVCPKSLFSLVLSTSCLLSIWVSSATLADDRSQIIKGRNFEPKAEFYFIYKYEDKVAISSDHKWISKKKPVPYNSCCYSVSKSTDGLWRESIFKTINEKLSSENCRVVNDTKNDLRFLCTLSYHSESKAPVTDEEQNFYTNSLASCEKVREEYKKAGSKLSSQEVISDRSPCQ